MPTKDRIEAVMVEVTENIDRLGYNVLDVVGPIETESEKDDEVDDFRYFITAEARNANFYIAFSTKADFAQISYPYNIARQIGRRLDHDELEFILGEQPDWENDDPEELNEHMEAAGTYIIQNSDVSSIVRGRFNLSVYASSSHVRYDPSLSEDGFPLEFNCNRGLFPFTNQVTLQDLDDRIESLVIAGERGRRYVENAFVIDKDDRKPDNYSLRVQI